MICQGNIWHGEELISPPLNHKTLLCDHISYGKVGQNAMAISATDGGSIWFQCSEIKKAYRIVRKDQLTTEEKMRCILSTVF